MAEPATAGGMWGFVAAATALAGFAALYLWLGAGVVTSSQHWPIWISVALYGCFGGLAVLGLARGLAAQRRRRLPFRPGRYLHTWGFVDARDPIVMMRSLADLERVQIDERPMPTLGDIHAVTVRLHFKDAVERLDLIARRAPRQELAGVEAHAKQLAELTISAPARAIELDPLAADKLPASHRPPWLASRARTIALVGGLATALVMLLVVLPFRSLAAVQGDGIFSQRTVERAFPWPWVHARVAARAEAAYQAVATKLGAMKLDPALRTAYEQLLAHARQTGDPEVRVSFSVPFGDALKPPDQQLAALAGGQATPAPIQFFTISGGPGDDRFVRALDDALRRFASYDVLHAGSSQGGAGAQLAITIPGIETVGMLRNQSQRAFAQLAFVFHARLIIPGAAPLDLGDFPVAAPDRVEVGRLAFGNEKLPPLGSSGDALEDAMVYKQELDQAATTAAQAIAAKLGASGALQQR